MKKVSAEGDYRFVLSVVLSFTRTRKTDKMQVDGLFSEAEHLLSRDLLLTLQSDQVHNPLENLMEGLWISSTNVMK